MSRTAAVAFTADDPWPGALRAAVEDIAANALGLRCSPRPDPGSDLELMGALVPIVGGDLPPLQLGLFSTGAGCDGIARALLGFGPRDKLTHADMIDALNEVTNMLSGATKVRVPAYARVAALGLPTFVHAPIEHSTAQQVQRVALTLGTIDVVALVVRAID